MIYSCKPKVPNVKHNSLCHHIKTLSEVDIRLAETRRIGLGRNYGQCRQSGSVLIYLLRYRLLSSAQFISNEPNADCVIVSKQTRATKASCLPTAG